MAVLDGGLVAAPRVTGLGVGDEEVEGCSDTEGMKLGAVDGTAELDGVPLGFNEG